MQTLLNRSKVAARGVAPSGMDDNGSSQRNQASPPLTAASVRSLIDSAHQWLGSVLELAILEGKKAGLGLALMLALSVGAITLLVAGWLMLMGCLFLTLVQGAFLSLTWSLVVAAMLNFMGAGGLIFLVIKRSHDLGFLATRRQLGFTSESKLNHDQSR